MPWLGLDVDQVVRLDDRRNITVHELTSVIMHNSRRGAPYRFQRRLQLDRHRFAVQADEQLVMHDIAAEGIDKAHQEVESGRYPRIHHVSVPLLIRRYGPEIVFATRSR